MFCGCVYRAIFRICLARFRDLSEGHDLQSPDFTKVAEFKADFVLIATRTLTGRDLMVFSRYFLQGLSTPIALRGTGLTSGQFFHRVYDVEEKLGRVFLETEPYSVFPLERYFGRTRLPRSAATWSREAWQSA